MDEKAAAGPATGGNATYRVDAPHSYAQQVALPGSTKQVEASVSPLKQTSTPVDSARLQSTISAALRAAESTSHSHSQSQSPQVVTAADPNPQPRSLEGVPLPLRAAAETWQVVQPHGKLIRFAATLALLIAGGMSVALFVRQRTSTDENASAITASHEPGATSIETQHAELHPTLEPVVAPDLDTTSIEPTATGPLAPASQPVMAVETATPAESIAAPSVTPPYPTTSFAEATLPPLRGSSLPQVRTDDPEVALRGDLLPTQSR